MKSFPRVGRTILSDREGAPPGFVGKSLLKMENR
jgi:hypothetical protein